MTTRKTRPPNPATATSASNVVPLRESVPVIEPEEGWSVYWKECLLRTNGAPEGKLVRLADVVRWLMKKQEFPLGRAVNQVCEELERASPPPLFNISSPDDGSDGYARLAFSEDESPWERFIRFTPEEARLPRMQRLYARQAKALRDVWLMRRHDLARLVNTPGEEAVYDERQTAFEWSESRLSVEGRVAVTFADAHRLWGWGKVTAPAVDAVDKPVESEWTPERLWDTLSRFKGDGKKAPMKRLSELSGIPDREIRRLIEPLKVVASSHFSGLLKQSNRGG